MAKDYLELAAVGDTATGREPPESIFEHVQELLRTADVRFAQVERLFSERGGLQLQAMSPHVRQNPRMATAYLSVPFDVVGVGSNHVGDWGPEAAEDTVATFRALDIGTVGAGRNIEDARKPAIVTKEGQRIAFLGYVTVLLPGYWATEDRAGAAPMRARTYYEPYEYQPGAPPRIVTVPNAKDLEQLQEDVRRARKEADHVVVSFHWGVHWIPRPLTDYQPIVAHAAVDAGATAILGHHPHVMQAVEIYKGAAIFYSLGNFAFYRMPGSHQYCLPNCEYTFDQVYSRPMEPGYTYRYDRFRMEGGIAFLQLDREGLRKVTFVPTVMNSERQATIVPRDSAKFEEIRTYLSWVSEGLEGGIKEPKVEGDRIVLFERQ